jgi:hypothetical protein
VRNYLWEKFLKPWPVCNSFFLTIWGFLNSNLIQCVKEYWQVNWIKDVLHLHCRRRTFFYVTVTRKSPIPAGK